MNKLLALLVIVGSTAFAAKQPNILFILADDVGREVLGSYGGSSYQTPHLDRLAADGMRFTHCYSMPVCHPTRVCLLSGKYPAALGNPKWGSYPKSEEGKTFAATMKQAGYATAVAGKWQLSLMKKDLLQPRRMGFDQWSVFGWHEGPRYHDPMIYENGRLREDTKGKYGPDLYVQFLIDFMKANRAGPFLAYYSMALAHDVTDDIGKPVPYGPGGHWPTYVEMANDMDVQVGKLIAALDKLDLRRNTLVLYTTDNGTAAASYLMVGPNGKYLRPPVYSRFNDRTVRGGKGKLNDLGTRVPMIANWPGRIQPGQVVDDLVDFSDILPTFAEIGDAPLPSGELNGVSFAGRLQGGAASPRKWAYSENSRGGQHWVRTADYKLYNTGSFYDMVNDPGERSALKAVPAKAKRVHRMLSKELVRLRDPKP
ncbi:MAG: sulfatase-like hydrolase/transferase [Verrucomicrobiia bacterium]|jgi:arylsulfatase A